MSVLIDLPIEEACSEKWRRGQAVYGLEFVGDPVLELHSELIDAMNYVQTASELGVQMGTMHAELHQMCERVRAIYATVRGAD